MRVRRIAVRNFGGVENSDVTFSADGVTVIEGENEAGKTTLLRAFDAIIEYADSSKSAKIREMVPVGKDVGPEVEVEIETGPYSFTYRKRWFRDRETVLEITKPSHEQLTGREAHDRVNQILDESLDTDLWKALRLDQGAALEQAEFTSSALGRALDAASGGDIAGEHDDALWGRVETEYARYWTRTGKPKEDLTGAKRELDAAREEAIAARDHVLSLDEDSAEVDRLTSQAETLEKAAADAEVGAGDLEEQVDKVRKIRHRIDAAVAERERAAASLGSTRSEREKRADQLKQLEEARALLTTIEGEVAGAEPERTLFTKEAASADKVAVAARTSTEKAREVYDRARGDAELRRQEIEIAQLKDRRGRVDAARKELADAAATIDAIAVDEMQLAAIEDAYLRVAELRAAVDSALPEVKVEALRDLTLTIDGADVELSASETREVTAQGRSEFLVKGVVGLVVTAGADGADIVQELRDAEASFAGLCESGAVSGFEDARAQFDRKSDAERTREAAHETIKRDLADLTFEELAHKVESLTLRISDYLETRSVDPSLPVNHSNAQEIESVAKQALDEGRSASEAAASRASAAKERLAELEKATAGREGKLEIARNAVASAGEVLDKARESQSDASITLAESEARSAFEIARSLVSDLEVELNALDAESLDALLANALARRDRNRRDLADLVERRRELVIRLTIETERGPARLVDEAETNLAEAERRHEAIVRRADAAALLHSTFQEHRSAAHRRYIQPFRDEIERLGRIVFGATFEVGLDEDLSIATRMLDNETLGFGQLSTGAQEQLGVLSRLACARLVSDEGGVPVVLDDALGWTDPERLDLMGAAISTAGDDCQVIILTCVPERYAGIGKARTVRL
jgi:DNA repair exonuclease SbcCD ATPase subunit